MKSYLPIPYALTDFILSLKRSQWTHDVLYVASMSIQYPTQHCIDTDVTLSQCCLPTGNAQQWNLSFLHCLLIMQQQFWLAVKRPHQRSHDIHKKLTWIAHSHTERLSTPTNIWRDAQSPRWWDIFTGRATSATSNCVCVTTATSWTRGFLPRFFFIFTTTSRGTASCKTNYTCTIKI